MGWFSDIFLGNIKIPRNSYKSLEVATLLIADIVKPKSLCDGIDKVENLNRVIGILVSFFHDLISKTE
jgi:metal-dependent HD superfamily phosphatase/phosphodiesterase